jgi:hypothetical protein
MLLQIRLNDDPYKKHEGFYKLSLRKPGRSSRQGTCRPLLFGAGGDAIEIGPSFDSQHIHQNNTKTVSGQRSLGNNFLVNPRDDLESWTLKYIVVLKTLFYDEILLALSF